MRQTDSLSNISDLSGGTVIQSRPRMDVACVLDTQQPEGIEHRKCALDELKQACSLVNANLQMIQFKKLDFGETNVLDTFYNADVVVIDLSVQLQQSALFYHLGVRESFGMKGSILMHNDLQKEQTLRLKVTRERPADRVRELEQFLCRSPAKATHFFPTSSMAAPA